MEMYDIIIVGAGPAGLTAAIYCGRRELKTLIISKDIGGQIAKAAEVENYPGFVSIPGPDLVQKFLEQAKKVGAELVIGEIEKIEKTANGFAVQTAKEKYESRALILAYGRTPRSLAVPGEKEFLGKGVSYCATCDMPVFRDKIVAVVGGGDSALDAALYGSKIAKKVYVIHRRDQFRAEPLLVERAEKAENIEFVLDSVVKETKGEQFVKSAIIENVKTKETKELALDGIFIEIGFEVKTDLVKDLVKLDDYKQIIVDNKCATSQPGVFAAGDITNTPIKQAVSAAGEGCKAALTAYAWLQSKRT